MRRGPVTVTFLGEGPPGPPRVAYAIGRRVGGAVQRNRLRRRLRALVADLEPDMEPGAYLIGAAPEAAVMGFEELRASLARALQAATER